MRLAKITDLYINNFYNVICGIMPRITYIKPKDEMIMYCDKPIIILPEKISVLRDVKNQSIYTDFEQYSIYYKNIIYPYSEEYDVQIGRASCRERV